MASVASRRVEGFADRLSVPLSFSLSVCLSVYPVSYGCAVGPGACYVRVLIIGSLSLSLSPPSAVCYY